MGAEQFEAWAKGETAQEAFDEAKEQAYYDVGHQGYSGTIAEKANEILEINPEPTKPE